MKQYQIAVLEGDGIGPEIIREGVKVLRAAAEIGGISLGLNYYPYGCGALSKNRGDSSGCRYPRISGQQRYLLWSGRRPAGGSRHFGSRSDPENSL